MKTLRFILLILLAVLVGSAWAQATEPAVESVRGFPPFARINQVGLQAVSTRHRLASCLACA